MKTTIIFLLGNRDLQLDAAFSEENSSEVALYFEAQNDGDDWVVRKRKDNQQVSFWEASKHIWEDYMTFSTHLKFPMIEESLSYLEVSRDVHLVFCTSHQSPPHDQDSYFFGETAACFFKEQGFSTSSDYFSCNPNDFEALVRYFSDLFIGEKEKCERLVISNSGGTPNMRAASHFAGIFRGFEYLHVNSFSRQVVSSTFQKQEELILKEIIESKLKVFDYEGILLLPSIDEKVRQLCIEGRDTYNLKTDYITKHKNYEERALAAIELIYSNMVVCYEKGAYADAIGRIQRLEEGIGQLLFYRLLDGEKLIWNNSKVIRIDSKGEEKKDKTFEDFIKIPRNKMKIVIDRFPETLELRTNYNHSESSYYFKNWESVPLLAVAGGKNFYYFLFKSLGIHVDLYSYFEVPNGNFHKTNNPLANLRNHSIVGHGFKGVSEADLENVVGEFNVFSKEIHDLIENTLSYGLKNVFLKLNLQIKKQLFPEN